MSRGRKAFYSVFRHVVVGPLVPSVLPGDVASYLRHGLKVNLVGGEDRAPTVFEGRAMSLAVFPVYSLYDLNGRPFHLKRYELASSEVVKVVGNRSVSSRMASSKSASARGFVLSSSGRLGGSDGSTGGPVEGGLTLYEAKMGLWSMRPCHSTPVAT